MLHSLNITGLFISFLSTSPFIMPRLEDSDTQLYNKQELLICPTWQKNKYEKEKTFWILAGSCGWGISMPVAKNYCCFSEPVVTF